MTAPASAPAAPQLQGGQGGQGTDAAIARGEERDRALSAEIALLREDFRRLESRLWALAGASMVGAGAIQAAVATLGG